MLGKIDWAQVVTPEIKFAELVEAKRMYIQNSADRCTAQLGKSFSLSEERTFAEQEAGADDILAGRLDTENAKFVIALAETRATEGGQSFTPEQFARRIARNVTITRKAMPQIVGKQQGMTDQLDALTEATDENRTKIAALVWEDDWLDKLMPSIVAAVTEEMPIA